MLTTLKHKPLIILGGTVVIIASLFFITLYLPAPHTTAAGADLNGYIAQYECRAGNPNCNVDVIGLTNQTCQVTVTTADSSWSKITGDSSKTVYCIQAGDHSNKGTLTLSHSGTASNRKVLRYYRSGDNNDEPWNQSGANQATVSALEINGSYWVIHRLTFPSIDDSSVGKRIYLGEPITDIIVNRILIDGMSKGGSNIYSGISIECCSSENITTQNSVIRNSWGKVGSEPMGINAKGGKNLRLVNNEIYDWSAHAIQMGRNGTPVLYGYVIENNDIYETSAMHLPNGKGRAKNPVSIKASGISTTDYGQAIQNRIWGARDSDTSVCCINGDAGAGLYNSSGGGHQYVLIQNNIVMNSQQGYAALNCSNGCRKTSLIGNIFYDIQKFTTKGSYAMNTSDLDSSEIYFNTIISNPEDGAIRVGGATNDIQCNVIIDSANFNGSPGSGTQVDNNVYYGVTGTKLDTNKIFKKITTRANSMNYSSGTIVYPSSLNNYLYMAKTDGTTASSPQTPCTALGCTYTDGTVIWQAIRGPYAFYRKLQTNPELYIIPYATVHSSAPEQGFCPSSTGSRSGIGINDDAVF